MVQAKRPEYTGLDQMVHWYMAGFSNAWTTSLEYNKIVEWSKAYAANGSSTTGQLVVWPSAAVQFCLLISSCRDKACQSSA